MGASAPLTFERIKSKIMDMIANATKELTEAHAAETPKDSAYAMAKTLGALPVIVEWVLWHAQNDGIISEDVAKALEQRMAENIKNSADRVRERIGQQQ
jgi:hypothetical protein